MSSSSVYLFLGPESGDKNREIEALRQAFRGGGGSTGTGESAASARNGSTSGGAASGGSSTGAGAGPAAASGQAGVPQEKSPEEAARKPPKKSIEEHILHGFDDDAATLVRLLRSPSLFSDGIFVVFRGIEQVRGADQAALLGDYLVHPSENTVLILESTENSLAKIPVLAKHGQLIPRQNQKVFWEMFENRREDWLRSRIRERGGSISRDAAELFLETVENNTETMAWEVDKLLLMHANKSEIQVEDIETYLFHSKVETPFTVFAYLAERNLENCLAAIPGILASEGTGIPVLAGIVRQLRILAKIKSLQPRGVPDTALLEEVGLKFKRAQASMLAAASRFSAAETAAALALALHYEFALREFGPAMHAHLLQLFCYQVIVRGGRGTIVTRSAEPDRTGVFSLSGM